MMNRQLSRRNLLAGSVAGAAAGAVAGAGAGALAVINPGMAAAQSVGVKSGDLPDLTIKEVKVYVTDIADVRHLNSTETGELLSVVTNSGHEGNYTIGNRNRTEGWLEWAKAALVGKNVLDVLPTLTATSGMKGIAGFGAGNRGGGGGGRGGGAGGAGRGAGSPAGGQGSGTFATGLTGRGMGPAFGGASVAGSGLTPRGGGSWPNYYTAAADVCLWDILGKAVNRPIYKILGGTKDRMMGYASSQHLATVEDFAPDALKAKELGYKAYKVHPGGGQHATGGPIPAYAGHMEELKTIRKAVGDEFVLAHDPVQRYNRFEAMKVGRLCDELDFAWYEDPIRTSDTEGLVELCTQLSLPIHVGEFLYSIADFAEYIRRGALDVVRLIADNVGGISGSMRVGLLADAFGLECTPHNWGNVLDLAVHFHLELALPNAYWFEVPFPAEYADRPYHKDKFRIGKDGYILAPTAPGLGYPIDRAALDKITKKIDR